MKILTVDTPWVREMGPLPAGAEVVHAPAPGVEFVVAGPELAAEFPGLAGQLPGLRIVQSTQAGVERLVPLLSRDIVVCSASGAHDIAVSEWIVAAILAMRRHLLDFYRYQQAHHWEANVNNVSATGPSPVGSIEDLDGATVVIVGYGSIGRATAARLQPFGVKTVGVAHHARADALTTSALPHVLPQADVVVLLTPLTEETTRMVDADFLARMKPGALLVNASRGGVVDTDALVAALAAGTIHAALDVTDPEPLPADHPLWSAPNVLITPHVAGATSRWLGRAYHFAGEQLRRYVKGEPLLNQQHGTRPAGK